MYPSVRMGIVLLSLGAAAFTPMAMAAQSSAPHKENATEARAVDPFQNESMAYERLEGRYRLLELQSKIAQARYKLAKYERQASVYGGRTTNTASGEPRALEKKIAALSSRVEVLARALAKMSEKRAVEKKPGTPARSAEAHKTPLLALLYSNGRWSALVREGTRERTVTAGERLAGVKIASVTEHGVRFANGRVWMAGGLVAEVSLPQDLAGANPSGKSAGERPGDLEQALKQQLLRQAGTGGRQPTMPQAPPGQ